MLEEEEHRAVRPINVGREHSEKTSEDMASGK
jgi:hypothetical protein